jgi:hypothetical protein
MKLVIGLTFTGLWFKGKVLVQDVIEDKNELKVRLQNDINDTEDDYWWWETWNLQHTRIGIDKGDYFSIIKPKNEN